MNEIAAENSSSSNSSVEEIFAKERESRIPEFVGTHPEYYQQQFNKIGADAGFVWTFNLWAGLMGPIWFCARSMWNWGLSFLILETFAMVQIIRGFFGDLAVGAWDRIGKIEGTLELRRQQLASAIENNTDKIEVYQRTVKSLEDSIGGIRLEAELLEASGLWIALSGIAMLVIVKAGQAVIANTLLEKRFSDWLSDAQLVSRMTSKHLTLAVAFVLLIMFANTVDGGCQLYYSAHLVVCGDHCRYLLRCISVVHGFSGVLGKSDDDFGPARNSGLPIDCYWHPARDVLRSS